MGNDLFDVIAGTGKALASGSRLRVLQLLAQGERGVQDLAGVAGLNLTTASAHLQVLRAAGLVASRRDGTSVIYRLAGDDVASLLTLLCRVAEAHRPDVRAELAAALRTDDVVSMTRSELLEASASGRVVVLDVRPEDEFAAGHLPGAVSIPLADLADRLAELPRETEVVAYCRGRHCVLSHDAARLLRAAGFTSRVSEDGVAEWVADGLALATGATA